MNWQAIGTIVSLVGLFFTVWWMAYQAKNMEEARDNAVNATALAYEARITALETILGGQKNYEARTTALETKVGLFWNLVENNLGDALAHANPIHLTPEEQTLALIYKYRKSGSSDDVLLKLDAAITREIPLGYMTYDEKMTFTLIQVAIKSQLLDRGIITT